MNTFLLYLTFMILSLFLFSISVSTSLRIYIYLSILYVQYTCNNIYQYIYIILSICYIRCYYVLCTWYNNYDNNHDINHDIGCKTFYAQIIGGVAERSNATDCNSVGVTLDRFESYPLHHKISRQNNYKKNFSSFKKHHQRK